MAANTTATFSYDPFGRRIYKSSSAATSIYAYDRQSLIEETNASGGVVARYSQGLNIDEPLAMQRGGTTSFYEADALGSNTSLSNTAGALGQAYTYDSFGNIANSSGSLTSPFEFTTRELDTETSLYFYRHRYYDQTTGRFLSEDPLGFRAAPNFYAYVFNNPVLRVDPQGLESGDLNRLVPGPNGEIAKNVPCPGCMDKMLPELQDELRRTQQVLGKPGCVVECSVLGFADDAAAVGLGLFSKTVRAFLTGATGKVVMKVAGVCGLGAAAIYCTTKCGVWNTPTPPPSQTSGLTPFRIWAWAQRQ